MILSLQRKMSDIKYRVNAMTFLKSITQEIAIVIVIFALFGLMFYLYHLPLEAYLLALGVILLLLLIFIGIKYLSFVKTISQQQQIENLENALYQLKNEQIEYKNDVESYFLTWVHQMKTPITAAQLLLERDEPNVVNRVRQEVIQIDNYTSLALSYLKLLNETSDISVTKISINNIIRPIIMKYSIQFIDQKTKIHYEPCHHEVLTDVRWTSLMIEQLINNALKYARGKDIWIEFDE